ASDRHPQRFRRLGMAHLSEVDELECFALRSRKVFQLGAHEHGQLIAFCRRVWTRPVGFRLTRQIAVLGQDLQLLSLRKIKKETGGDCEYPGSNPRASDEAASSAVNFEHGLLRQVLRAG